MITSITELIVLSVVLSFCASALVGTLVYCTIKKKHEEDMDWLFKLICDIKTDVSRLHEFNSLYTNYKEQGRGNDPASEYFLNWKGLDEDGTSKRTN